MLPWKATRARSDSELLRRSTSDDGSGALYLGVLLGCVILRLRKLLGLRTAPLSLRVEGLLARVMQVLETGDPGNEFDFGVAVPASA